MVEVLKIFLPVFSIYGLLHRTLKKILNGLKLLKSCGHREKKRNAFRRGILFYFYFKSKKGGGVAGFPDLLIFTRKSFISPRKYNMS